MVGKITFRRKLRDDGTWLHAKVYLIDGVEVSATEFRRRLPPPKPSKCFYPSTKRAWPLRSEALGVHPKQVAGANARNAEHGIAARYEADGTCVIPDRADRKKLLKLEGFHDKSGGYGD